MSKPNEAFNTLLALSESYSEEVRGLPAQVDVTPTQAVVCFSLVGVNLAVALDEVAELLELPVTTRLPRVKSWITGVANVRGRLLPLVNFAAFLGGVISTPPKQQRVVVIDLHEIFVGLTVDRVHAMRHFRLDTYSTDVTSAPDVLAPYIEGSFSYEDEDWFLFRPVLLLNDPRFISVAA